MFQCSQCDKSYQRKAHLQRHQLTHASRPASVCPFCGKSFLKPEVARRHSKSCAPKFNLPPVPAAKPGRKRQSCDQCFATKRACDRRSPCSRCSSLAQACTFESQETLSTTSPDVKENAPFSFLRHFTNPRVERDRLAIAETAECSVRRNLDGLYSHLENALAPLDSMPIFGDFLGAEFLLQPPPPMNEYDLLTCGPTTLSQQLDAIVRDLIETSTSMGLDDSDPTLPLSAFSQLAPLFTVSNLAIFISAFFHSLHWHLPVVHFPTFEPGSTSSPLLLSIFLAGAAYSSSVDQSALLPRLLDVAEEYVFRMITRLSTQLDQQTSGLVYQHSAVQLIQAALIIEMLQFGQEKIETRRRIRIIRHPGLVSLMRCLGFFNLKRSMAPTAANGDDGTWRALVAEESCIRLASWVFLADGFLTLCFKNRPTITSSELDCSFPWRTELWEAGDAATFSRSAVTHRAEISLPSVRDAVRLLLDHQDAGSIPSSLSLSAEHLLILIYALNSLAFLARIDSFGSVPLARIRGAATKWKGIWNSVYTNPKNEKVLLLGYPKHAEELWLLLMATLDIASHNVPGLPYLDEAATDDLGKLNEFIQWCCEYIQPQTTLKTPSPSLSAA